MFSTGMSLSMMRTHDIRIIIQFSCQICAHCTVCQTGYTTIQLCDGRRYSGESGRSRRTAIYLSVRWHRRSAQSWCDHPYRKPCGSTWCYYSEKPRGWFNCNGSKNFCRSVELHTGSKSNKLKRNHERTEKTGTLVCLCRYGW